MTPHLSNYLSSNLHNPHPYLEEYSKLLETEKIVHARTNSLARLEKGHLTEYVKAISEIDRVFSTDSLAVSGETIRFGRENCLSSDQSDKLRVTLKKFAPWKKGPFDFFGIFVDSEWKCQIKWQEILPYLVNIEGKIVADIGCNNGYYMYKLLDLQPDLVIGFEPVLKHLLSFQLMQKLHPTPSLCFEPIGLENLNYYPKFFDTILCMGILYHHTDPVAVLRKMFHSLKPKGQVIIDCMGIEGSDPICLVPRKQYANTSGNWFLPTASCVENWLRRSGYRNIDTFFSQPLTTEEQRRTQWADINSLSEGLDPSNPKRTVEGYPAPWRHYLVAQR